MALTLIVVALALWVFYMALKFYLRADWEEAPESSPDFQQMHKRQAQLLQIQEVLDEAGTQGKLSPAAVEEFHRFCNGEAEALRQTEAAWRARPRSAPN